MKKLNLILLATVATAAVTFVNTASAGDSLLPPKMRDAFPKVVASGVKDADYVHNLRLGYASASKSHPVVVGKPTAESGTIAMVRGCTLPPKLKGDTAACVAHCAKN
jgi:hypothetical protein